MVVVGTTEQVESEGFDRTSLALPGRQDELVARVAQANPRTIVVVNAGSPVLLPWADDVAAVLLTWFGGQEAGAALADVLLGVARAGRPAAHHLAAPRAGLPGARRRAARRRGRRTTKGVFVGYRAWQRAGARPLYAFGHGLGYTTWQYESLQVADGFAEVTVTNTGARAGREVIQVYAGPTGEPPVGVGPAAWCPTARRRGWPASPTSRRIPARRSPSRIPLPERTFQVWDEGWHTVPGGYAVTAAHALDDPRLTEGDGSSTSAV